MINPFIHRLPLDIRTAMQNEYQRQKVELAHWRAKTKSPRNNKYLIQIEALDMIVALGIYYRTIIAPIEGTEEFITRLTRNGADFMIAGKPFNKQQLIGLREGLQLFERITLQYGLNKQILSERDVKTMLLKLIHSEEIKDAFHEVPI